MISPVANAIAWLRSRDRDLVALRRAGRAAIVMPAMFAVGDKVIGNLSVATFAAFGSFAMLLLVDYGGIMRDRLIALASLAGATAVLVCLGTIASRSTWLAAGAMAVIGVGVLFAGVVSSVLASSTTALLISFILPVTLPGTLSSIPDRLEGWGLAAGAAFVAVAVLWPAPVRNPLRVSAASTCRALAERLHADVAFVLGEGISAAEREAAAARSDAAVEALDRLFFATPFRPTGLSTSARALVRLVDELSWLNLVLAQAVPHPNTAVANRPVCAVKQAAASVLEEASALLETPRGDPARLRTQLARLRELLVTLEASVSLDVPPRASGVDTSQVVSALDPGFRAQELTFAVSQVAANIDLASMAERRSPLDRLLGRQPAGLTNTLAAFQERAAGHVDLHSVWLRNSIRAALGLAIAVAIAAESGVQHSFWVVLGTLSVLRSNALSTGQNVLRALAGTAAGFAIGAALIWVIGANTTLLWFLLPVAILFAGFAPAAISFAAGQAAFTVTLVILFNILQPLGWRVGLIRVEDAALGCAVSLGVGVLLWPRGAAAALGRALAEAYVASAGYLGAAVEFGVARCDPRLPAGAARAPEREAVEGAAAARRLDDAFRTYLAERGAKPVPLPGITSLVTGVAGLRLAADAIVELWGRDDGSSSGDRAEATRELRAISGRVAGWYGDFATFLTAGAAMPPALSDTPGAAERLVETVRRDLTEVDGSATGLAVRVIWTGDHLDAARRLQGTLTQPAEGLIAQARDPFGSVSLRRRTAAAAHA